MLVSEWILEFVTEVQSHTHTHTEPNTHTHTEPITHTHGTNHTYTHINKINSVYY